MIVDGGRAGYTAVKLRQIVALSCMLADIHDRGALILKQLLRAAYPRIRLLTRTLCTKFLQRCGVNDCAGQWGEEPIVRTLMAVVAAGLIGIGATVSVLCAGRRGPRARVARRPSQSPTETPSMSRRSLPDGSLSRSPSTPARCGFLVQASMPARRRRRWRRAACRPAIRSRYQHDLYQRIVGTHGGGEGYARPLRAKALVSGQYLPSLSPSRATPTGRRSARTSTMTLSQARAESVVQLSRRANGVDKGTHDREGLRLRPDAERPFARRRRQSPGRGQRLLSSAAFAIGTQMKRAHVPRPQNRERKGHYCVGTSWLSDADERGKLRMFRDVHRRDVDGPRCRPLRPSGCWYRGYSHRGRCPPRSSVPAGAIAAALGRDRSTAACRPRKKFAASPRRRRPPPATASTVRARGALAARSVSRGDRRRRPLTAPLDRRSTSADRAAPISPPASARRSPASAAASTASRGRCGRSARVRDAANAALARAHYVATIRVPEQTIAGGHLKLEVVTATHRRAAGAWRPGTVGQADRGAARPAQAARPVQRSRRRTHPAARG